MGDHKYQRRAKRHQDGEETVKAAVDQFGSAFVNGTYRHHEAVTINTALTYPCDGLSVSADSTLSVQGEEDAADTAVPVTLKAGQIHPVSVAKVLSASGTPTITAHYIRKPTEEV